MCVLFIFLLSPVFFAWAEDPPKEAGQDFTGTWVYEVEDKNPDNPAPVRLLTFSLTLSREGRKISGKYEYVTAAATRIREGTISGSCRGNTAMVKFQNPEVETEKGTAALHLITEGLEWKLLTTPTGDCYLPEKAVLKKK